MKNIGLFFVAILVCLTACQKPASAPVDKEAAQKAVADLFDSYAKAIKAEDVNGISALLADDGLFVGTDPGEFWNKEQAIRQFEAMAKDTAVSMEFSSNKRDIRISSDGTMAVVTEQVTIPMISNKVQVRGNAHASSVGSQWKIDYYSWSLIPKNEDIAKINAAL